MNNFPAGVRPGSSHLALAKFLRPVLRRLLGLTIFGAASVCLSATDIASPQSQSLRLGAADLAHGSYETALQKFTEATRLDPGYAEAHFFRGVALNRLARHAEALAQLQKAHSLGSPHPDQAFETGWSLVGLERWEKAVVELERFDKTSPGRGQTQEFLGRAFLGLGRYDRADAAFREALRRNPNLKPTVQVWQAMLEQRRTGATAPRKSVTDSLRDLPDSRLRSLLGKFRTGAGREPQKAWNVSVSMGGGYNSNALFLGNGIPVPADSSRKSSPFSRFTLDGDYTWRFRNGDSVTAGYSFDGQFYSVLPAVDEANHLAFIDYRHPFAAGKLVASVRASDTFTQIGGDRFRNTVGVRPALAYNHSEHSTTEVSYAWASGNYYTASLPVQARDGTSHLVTLSQTLRPAGTQLQVVLGAYYLVNDTDGADFDYHSTGVFVSLRHPLPWKMSGDITYSHSWDRYENNNSLASPAYSAKRSDNINSLALQVTRPLGSGERYKANLYVRYALMDDDSNISYYNYRQNVISAGFIISY